MREFITFDQIRVNAVLGVCARQRELVAENKRLQQKAKKNIADMIASFLATALIFSLLFI